MYAQKRVRLLLQKHYIFHVCILWQVLLLADIGRKCSCSAPLAHLQLYGIRDTDRNSKHTQGSKVHNFMVCQVSMLGVVIMVWARYPVFGYLDIWGYAWTSRGRLVAEPGRMGETTARSMDILIFPCPTVECVLVTCFCLCNVWQ